MNLLLATTILVNFALLHAGQSLLIVKPDESQTKKLFFGKIRVLTKPVDPEEPHGIVLLTSLSDYNNLNGKDEHASDGERGQRDDRLPDHGRGFVNSIASGSLKDDRPRMAVPVPYKNNHLDEGMDDRGSPYDENDDDGLVDGKVLGIPGMPDSDYPRLASIPQTSFSCAKVRRPGYYADTETRCQVWHYCQLDMRQDKFLCPNGTIFNQETRICDWWFNVKCPSQANLDSGNADYPEDNSLLGGSDFNGLSPNGHGPNGPNPSYQIQQRIPHEEVVHHHPQGMATDRYPRQRFNYDHHQRASDNSYLREGHQGQQQQPYHPGSEGWERFSRHTGARPKLTGQRAVSYGRGWRVDKSYRKETDSRYAKPFGQLGNPSPMIKSYGRGYNQYEREQQGIESQIKIGSPSYNIGAKEDDRGEVHAYNPKEYNYPLNVRNEDGLDYGFESKAEPRRSVQPFENRLNASGGVEGVQIESTSSTGSSSLI